MANRWYSCYKFIRWCQVEVQHCSFKDRQVEQSIVAYDEAHKPTLKMALLLGDAISDLPKEYIQVGNGLDAHGTQKPTRTGVFVCSDLNAGRGGLMGEGLAGEAQRRPPMTCSDDLGLRRSWPATNWAARWGPGRFR